MRVVLFLRLVATATPTRSRHVEATIASHVVPPVVDHVVEIRFRRVPRLPLELLQTSLLLNVHDFVLLVLAPRLGQSVIQRCQILRDLLRHSLELVTVLAARGKLRVTTAIVADRLILVVNRT